MKDITIKKIHWKEKARNIKKLNINLYNAIDSIIESTSNPYLYEISIPYGKKIIHEGISNILDESVHDLKYSDDIDVKALNKDFLKGGFPLALITDGIVEIYKRNNYKYSTDKDIIYTYPFKILKKGDVFGTFEAMDDMTSTNFLADYSMTSGHKSIYPILPNPGKGNSKFNKIIEPYVERYQEKKTSFKDVLNFNILEILQEDIASEVSYSTKLLLIPKTWHIANVKKLNEFQTFIAKTSWEQMRGSTLNDKDIKKLHNLVKKSNPSSIGSDFFIAQLINYIDKAGKGNMPVLKFHFDSNYSYLNDIYDVLKDIIKDTYNPVLLHFDLLKKGQTGMLPLINFPFDLGSQIKIRSSLELYRDLEGLFSPIITEHHNNLSKNTKEFSKVIDMDIWEHMIKNTYYPYNKNPIKTDHKSETTSREFLLNKCDNMSVYSAGILTKIIVEIAKKA